jgi:hypothetical protein
MAGKTPQEARAARLEAELRANLKKRKEQSRARTRGTSNGKDGNAVANDAGDVGE